MLHVWIFAVQLYLRGRFTLFFNPRQRTRPRPSPGPPWFSRYCETSIIDPVPRVEGGRTGGEHRRGDLPYRFVTWSLFGRPPEPFYVFFAAVDRWTLFIVGTHGWKRETASTSRA
jgi:hypothetical protein